MHSLGYQGDHGAGGPALLAWKGFKCLFTFMYNMCLNMRAETEQGVP